MRHTINNFLEETEELFIVEEEHKKQTYLDFFAFIDLVYDVIHLYSVHEVLFELFPVIVILFYIILEGFLHIWLEDFHELVE